jgi:hypothetical protein
MLLVSPVQYGRQLELDKAGMGEPSLISPAFALVPKHENTALASPRRGRTKGIWTMTRSLGRSLLLAVLLLPMTSQAQAGDCYQQWMGCGYGPGYNAPSKQAGCRMSNNWGRGCCEIPSNWRLHVWDGYQGDPADYQRSLIGAQPDYNRAPILKVYSNLGTDMGAAPVAGMGAGAPCANCQNGVGAYPYGTAMPVTGPVPAATDFQPDVQSGRVNSSIRD